MSIRRPPRSWVPLGAGSSRPKGGTTNTSVAGAGRGIIAESPEQTNIHLGELPARNNRPKSCHTHRLRYHFGDRNAGPPERGTTDSRRSAARICGMAIPASGFAAGWAIIAGPALASP
jgi:hypothetical protein